MTDENTAPDPELMERYIPLADVARLTGRNIVLLRRWIKAKPPKLNAVKRAEWPHDYLVKESDMWSISNRPRWGSHRKRPVLTKTEGGRDIMLPRIVRIERESSGEHSE